MAGGSKHVLSLFLIFLHDSPKSQGPVIINEYVYVICIYIYMYVYGLNHVETTHHQGFQEKATPILWRASAQDRNGVLDMQELHVLLEE